MKHFRTQQIPFNSAIITFIAAALFCGCRSSDPRMIMAVEGGSICLHNGNLAGSCLAIPPGALSSDVTITLRQTWQSIAPGPSRVLSDVIIIEPENIELSRPATLRLSVTPATATRLSRTTNGVLFRQIDGVDYTAIGRGALSNLGNVRISTQIGHFGRFQLGLFVSEPLEVGDFVEVPMGAGSGGLALETSASALYLFQLSGFPEDIATIPDAALISSDYVVDASQPAAELLASPMRRGSSLQPHSPPSTTSLNFDALEDGTTQREVDGMMRDRERWFTQLSTQGLPAGLAPSPLMLRTGSGLNFSAMGDPNLPDVGETVPNIRMLNILNGTTFTFNGVVQVVETSTTPKFSIIVDENSSVSCLSQVQSALRDNILATLSTFFGDVSDVDNDEYIHIIMYPLPSFVIGFYLADNVFEYDPSNNPASNEADIVFVTIPSINSMLACSAPSNEANLRLLEATIGHEIQHLINFNKKTLERISDPNEVATFASFTSTAAPVAEPFSNEGLSYVAEMLTGYGTVASGPMTLVEDVFLNGDQSEYSLIDNSGFVSSETRGMNFAYLWYLFEQVGGASQTGMCRNYIDNGGATFLQSLLSNEATGVGSYGELFEVQDGLERPFQTAFMDFLLTLYNELLDPPLYPAASRFRFNDRINDQCTGDLVGVDFYPSTMLTINAFETGAYRAHGRFTAAGGSYLHYRASLNPQGSLQFSIESDEPRANLQVRMIRIE